MSNNTITAPKGFSASGVACGIKDSKSLDMGLLVADEACPAAAVFTKNRFCGAPVIVGREHLRGGRLRAVVVNSGRANVATGDRGIADARTMCARVATAIGARSGDVIPLSTGVIGAYLPMARIRHGIGLAAESLSSSAVAGRLFARAILTTDTRVKEACERIRIGKSKVTVAGCCKGSGMIAPNMATMLGFITTDAGLPARTLKRLLHEAVDPTFNRVTVDECQSTSDTVVVLASGASASLGSQRSCNIFAEALHEVCARLAYEIAADGEGATRVLEITVRGARSAVDAHSAARAIGVSPLVKTAVHGGDPNWGRIVQALGATEVDFKPEKVRIWIGGILVFARSAPSPRLNEAQLARAMTRKCVPILVDLGAGRAQDRVLTCDLSREYVSINADYHT